MKLYSVRDVATEKFGPVFEMENDTAAIRAFRNSVKGNPFKHDMELYHLGTFDSESGAILPDKAFIFKEVEDESAV